MIAADDTAPPTTHGSPSGESAAGAPSDGETASPAERPKAASGSAPASIRAVAEALVAERARMVEASREIASLKGYAQSLENQLLDIRLAARTMWRAWFMSIETISPPLVPGP